MSLMAVPEMRTVRIHGHRRAFVIAGEGPALLAIHGIGHDHRTWLPALPTLAEHFTVIAPDLLGHGSSDKPRADYSLGAFANGMRDLLTVLGINRATVMGNSLGGGVAMQFAYQFPERTERVVLVAAGGLGKTGDLAADAFKMIALGANGVFTGKLVLQMAGCVGNDLGRCNACNTGLCPVGITTQEGSSRGPVVCKARNPDCRGCLIADLCLYPDKTA